MIEKHRNGPTGSVKLKFIDRLAKFTDLEGGGDFNGGYDAAQGISPATDFIPPSENTIIRGSKMNDIEEEPF